MSVTVFFHSEWDGCESHIDGQIPSEQRIEEIGQEIAKRAEVSDSLNPRMRHGLLSDRTISGRIMRRDFRRIRWPVRIVMRFF